MRNGCATIIVLNKWDVTDTDLEDAKARVATKLRLRPRVITASALKGRNVTRLIMEAVALADRSRARIATADLNRFVAEVQSQRSPPAVRGRRLRIYYASQVESGPPRFRLYVNDRRLVVRDYGFFVENRLRERYHLEGVPLVIDFVDRERRERRPGGSPQERGRADEDSSVRALRSRLTLDRIALAVVLIGVVLVVSSLVQGSDGGTTRATARSTSCPRTRCCTCTCTSTPRVTSGGGPTRSCASCPRLRRLRDRALDSLSRGRRPLDFETQVRPWIGDEAAVALLREGRPRHLTDPGACRRPAVRAPLPRRARAGLAPSATAA